MRKEVVPIDTLQLLDDLEEDIGTGWPVPGVGRAMVDVDRAMEMIESIRASLPQEVEEARQIVAERESLLDQAHAEAERLVEEAQREAAELGWLVSATMGMGEALTSVTLSGALDGVCVVL